jgi:glycosyltransferase involved in cell wall biosynthesis
VEEQRSRQELYRKIMRQSLTVLCPRGAGENSVRFFETMAMGRIPVLIADNAALPMEAVIPYDEFVIRVPENEIDGIAEHILRWLSRRTNDQINDACLKARHSWHSWLRIEQVPALVAYELSRRNPGLNSGERVL